MFKLFKKRPSSTQATLQKLLAGVVDISENAIEAGISGGELAKMAQSLRTVASTVATAAEEFNSTAATISQNTTQMAQQSSMVSKTLDTTTEMMQTIEQRMLEAATINEEMDVATRNINQLTAMIEEVADQTNLLALNASIEAARAGEHGRGFAIVADEVRKLSIETQKSAETIRARAAAIQTLEAKLSQIIESTNKQLTDSVQQIQQVNEASKELDAVVENINNATREQQSASALITETIHEVLTQSEQNLNHATKVADSVDGIIDRVEAQRAELAQLDIPQKVLYLSKTDHMLWKKKLVDFEFHRINLKPEDVANHTLCRLGKWYYSQGKDTFGKTDIFKAMEEPHKRVHAAALKATERRAKDRNANIADLRDELNIASEEVVRCLDGLINKK